MKLVLRILSLIRHRANKNQFYLEIGTYFLRKGVGYKIGDPIKYKPNPKSRPRQYYIANLYYDFAKNRVTHKVTKNLPK